MILTSSNTLEGKSESDAEEREKVSERELDPLSPPEMPSWHVSLTTQVLECDPFLSMISANKEKSKAQN